METYHNEDMITLNHCTTVEEVKQWLVGREADRDQISRDMKTAKQPIMYSTNTTQAEKINDKAQQASLIKHCRHEYSIATELIIAGRKKLYALLNENVNLVKSAEQRSTLRLYNDFTMVGMDNYDENSMVGQSMIIQAYKNMKNIMENLKFGIDNKALGVAITHNIDEIITKASVEILKDDVKTRIKDGFQAKQMHGFNQVNRGRGWRSNSNPNRGNRGGNRGYRGSTRGNRGNRGYRGNRGSRGRGARRGRGGVSMGVDDRNVDIPKQQNSKPKKKSVSTRQDKSTDQHLNHTNSYSKKHSPKNTSFSNSDFTKRIAPTQTKTFPNDMYHTQPNYRHEEINNHNTFDEEEANWQIHKMKTPSDYNKHKAKCKNFKVGDLDYRVFADKGAS